MARNSRHSFVEKLECIDLCIKGKASIRSVALAHDLGVTTLRDWIQKYQTFGTEGIRDSTKNKSYSATLKKQAVQDYLSGQGSQADICKKYGIISRIQLRSWIKKYNGHEKLKTSDTGGKLIMNKGRKTTFEERVAIVQHCIAHEHNYAKTAEKYQVSYQQARDYTVKYETNGINGLQDKRGKRKSEADMNELERLRAENKILRAEKERAEMEASFLKKLAEIERRRC